MILTDSEISKSIEAGELQITPFEPQSDGLSGERLLQPASYDLRVGAEGLSTSSGGKVNLADGQSLVLRPAEFAVVITHEVVKFPAHLCGHFGLRSFFSRRGVVATTGLQIDPGYEGRLVVGLTNLSSREVYFNYRQHFLTMEVCRLEQPASRPYDGPNRKMSLDESDLELITRAGDVSLGNLLSTVQPLVSELTVLSDRVKRESELYIREIEVLKSEMRTDMKYQVDRIEQQLDRVDDRWGLFEQKMMFLGEKTSSEIGLLKEQLQASKWVIGLIITLVSLVFSIGTAVVLKFFLGVGH